MKKISLLIVVIFLAISCTKEDSPSDPSKSGYESYLSMSMTDGARGSSSGTGGGDGNGNGNGIEPGQITAAEWNDLGHWIFWMDLINGQDYSKMPGYWSFDLSKRISVKLSNLSSEPAVDIKIELIDAASQVLWIAKTDNFGKAELWPGMHPVQSIAGNLKLRIENQDFEKPKFFEAGINEISLADHPIRPQNISQIAFMVDATGSMADELEYLKAELVDVISEVRSSNPNTAIVTGSVFYRDEGDVYVTKASGFTTDTDNTIQFIKQQYAEGGGDFPEAVHTALNESLKTLQWSPEATSRLLFILLDAPPHYEEQIVSQIHSEVRLASEKGIKIVPITASGIDKETEFLMRYMAIATNGTYVFITNDSGIGNDHLEASVGEYEVEYLNDLMVRLINKYLE
ncbi:MAG: VWA domain-containing protein [Bacteroidales bacterium]|nr:VWA domain-containing protein [Bacteroidales bacterium]